MLVVVQDLQGPHGLSDSDLRYGQSGIMGRANPICKMPQMGELRWALLFDHNTSLPIMYVCTCMYG